MWKSLDLLTDELVVTLDTKFIVVVRLFGHDPCAVSTDETEYCDHPSNDPAHELALVRSVADLPNVVDVLLHFGTTTGPVVLA